MHRGRLLRLRSEVNAASRCTADIASHCCRSSREGRDATVQGTANIVVGKPHCEGFVAAMGNESVPKVITNDIMAVLKYLTKDVETEIKVVVN